MNIEYNFVPLSKSGDYQRFYTTSKHAMIQELIMSDHGDTFEVVKIAPGNGSLTSLEMYRTVSLFPDLGHYIHMHAELSPRP